MENSQINSVPGKCKVTSTIPKHFIFDKEKQKEASYDAALNSNRELTKTIAGLRANNTRLKNELIKADKRIRELEKMFNVQEMYISRVNLEIDNC